jgi:hypothetical protein
VSDRAHSRRRRGVSFAAFAAIWVICACALAPAALAAGTLNNELAEKVQQQEAETPATTATTNASSSSESGGSNTKTLVIAGSAAGALLAAIAFVIVRDARRVAPVADTQLGDAAVARRSATQLRRRRAKAKAARQQRKRNR